MKRHILSFVGLTLAAACSGQSEETVQKIIDDFQPTVDKIIENGLAAKDASTQGANITPVTASGDEAGTLTIGGKVAQSSGANENLDLWVQLDSDYSDTGKIIYATDNTSDTTKLQLDIQITAQPQDNRMSGSIVGPLTVEGDVNGSASFNLTFEADLADDDANPTLICSHVTGSVTSNGATVNVDFVVPPEKENDAACTAL